MLRRGIIIIDHSCREFVVMERGQQVIGVKLIQSTVLISFVRGLLAQ
jgi:hypothetical protein